MYYMATKEYFTHSMSVKNNAKTAVKLRFYPAEQWGKEHEGLYRLKLGRAWVDDEDKGKAFFTLDGAFQFLKAPFPSVVKDAGKPAHRRNMYGYVSNPMKGTVDTATRDKTRILTDPIKGFDGRYYVSVSLFGRGMLQVPCDEIELAENKRG